jgi:phenylacetate-CoA ligase
MAKKRRTLDRLSWIERHAFVGEQSRQLLTLQSNLEASQWWPHERIAQFQAAQLGRLLEHAYRYVPRYGPVLDAAGIAPGARFDWDRWRDVAPLTRDHLQADADTLRARSLPPGHEEIGRLRSSGSTGRAVEVVTTSVNNLWQQVLTLRTQIWADRDFTRTMGVIRKLAAGDAPPPEGDALERWGDASSFPFATGPCVRLAATAEIGEQKQWLEKRRPTYLTTYPSILRELAAAPPSARPFPIEGVSTLGETVDHELRDLVAQQWGSRVSDAYSAEEVGCMAIECPEGGGYHAQAETAIVEVLDAAGAPCRPGEVGEVVVTPLFNYAMPLLRYAIGDYAEAGGPCRCGRGLPLIRRIVGRQRNMLVLADGRSYWPTFGTRALARVAPILQQQFHQSAHDRLEVRLVVGEALNEAQESAIKERIQKALPAPFRIDLHYVADIPRNDGGKYELFTSAVASARQSRTATTSA